jgi:thioredoxin reductase
MTMTVRKKPMDDEHHTMNDSHDVIVIGGSFAGIAAALQLARARRRVLVVDDGKPRNRFAAAAHGFLGQDGRPPAEILADARAQLERYPTVSFLRDRATEARAHGADSFDVELSSGATARARRLILATGVVDELPDIPGLTERWGRTVLHCPYCHGYEVADGRLGVLTRGDASVHLAPMLLDWSADVTLFTNGAFPGSPNERSALEARGIRVVTDAVTALSDDASAPVMVELHGGATIPLDALFAPSRTRVASPIAERLGCELEEGPQSVTVRTDSFKETNVKGVFCAGDAGRPWQNLSFAVADGVAAGVAAHRSLFVG